MSFISLKDAGKKDAQRDTLYFNAYTEDLFSWDNDLDRDTERVMRIDAESGFFDGFKELAVEDKIRAYLACYCNFDFKIDYAKWHIIFSRGEASHIKISRGEENIFIWCVFLAIYELAIEGAEAYAWVRYIYIDDPISSLDDNNAIAVGSDLAKLLRRGRKRLKTVISSHHSLFFNVMCNELKNMKDETNLYFLHRGGTPDSYTLRKTTDTPFFHHVALLSEIKQAAETGTLFTHHFNMLRCILEKTAAFFGYADFSICFRDVEDDVLFARALNLLSHGNYSLYEPREMVPDNKALFRNILDAFLGRYQFRLPEIFTNENKEENQA